MKYSKHDLYRLRIEKKKSLVLKFSLQQILNSTWILDVQSVHKFAQHFKIKSALSSYTSTFLLFCFCHCKNSPCEFRSETTTIFIAVRAAALLGLQCPPAIMSGRRRDVFISIAFSSVQEIKGIEIEVYLQTAILLQSASILECDQ